MMLITFILSGCSIYKSAGRKDFEDKASGRTQTLVGTASVKSTTECWVQPKDQALWNQKTENVLIIQSLNETQLSVCVGRSDETPTL